MYIDYGDSIENHPKGNMNKSKSVLVNSCGTYRLISKPMLQTCRPEGRCDYQIIYIASGKGYFYFDPNTPTVLEAGHFILYRPYTYQNYIYYGEDHPSIYWIHFTGADIDHLFNTYGIRPAENVISTGVHPHFEETFLEIILELQLQRLFSEDRAAFLFMQLILMIGRHKTDREQHSENAHATEIDLSRAYFHKHYQENINVEEYARNNGMSLSFFFRKFKAQTGLSPLQYILEIRLANAQRLLTTTDYSINEIARIVGYENALYFSRLFHKHIGQSPREYRESYQ